LFVALESAKLTVPRIERNEPTVPDFPAARNRTESEAPRVSDATEASGSNVQWEMVIPKMARPSSSRISSITEIAPPPVAHPAPLTLHAADSPGSVAPLPTPRRSALQLRLGATSLAVKLLVAAALAAGVAIPILLRVYGSEPQASVEAAIPGGAIPGGAIPGGAIRGGGWIRQPSAPIGAEQARQLVLYRPSLGATDCRLEFTWKVSDRAVAWTFRAKDADNYYAMAIKALRPGPSPALSVEHFTVYQGIESPHAGKVLILGESNSALQVRMDVSGATFKLYLEGNAADYWTDNRLRAGGLGFLEQPDQPADVQFIRMSFSQAGGA